MKYLADRYQRGMDAVTAMLKDTQRFVHVDDLSEAGNDVIGQLNASGSQSLLS